MKKAIAISIGAIVFVISMYIFDIEKPPKSVRSYQVDTLVFKNDIHIDNYPPLKVEIIDSPIQSEWSKIKGPLLGIVSGALIAIFTVWLTNFYNKRQKRKDEIKNYKTILITSKNELEFYLTKLKQLNIESDNIIIAIKSGSDPLIPSYSIYPKFLEDSKIGLSKFYKNVEIVKKIGHCHFELSHISERLEQVKKELRTKFNSQIQIINITGFIKLIELNITEFVDTIQMIQKEIEKL